MEEIVSPRELELPLQLQFAMRKAQVQAQELTWDQLYNAFLNLYQRRLMEWSILKDILMNENIEVEFDIPTQLELMQLACMCQDNEDDEDEE